MRQPDGHARHPATGRPRSGLPLQRRAPPADLARAVDSHWIVSWDLRGHEPYRSQVMPRPAVHLVFEPHGAAVHGVPRRRYDRVLEGAGWAVGTKFAPSQYEAQAAAPPAT
ncbi:MAG TPA: DUF6597 domain-containing transcriptional factor [Solirubrobacteraceae bacterium]|jgi:hypothetical protein